MTSKCGEIISGTLIYQIVCHVFVFTRFWGHLWSIIEQMQDNMESFK